MPAPIHSVLVEFRPAAAHAPSAQPVGAADGGARAAHSPLLGPSPRELAAAEEAGFARGRAEALAEILAEAENRVALAREEAIRTARAEHAAELERAREEWAQAEGAALAATLTRGLENVETSIARRTARALRPFLREAVRDKAIAALCDTLRDLLRSEPSATLRMSGPEDLLDAVMRRIAGFEGKIAISVVDAPDIRVVCDETTIETQIALWASSLAIADE